MAEMYDDELLSLIRAYEGRAKQGEGQLTTEREKALQFYHGELDISPPDGGRSNEISTDVRDTVDGMLPDLLEVFLGSERVVEFDATKAANEEEAKQKTDAANYVFYKQNPGALILYEWFKTAMLEKNGIVKYYWEEKQGDEDEEYDALTAEEVQALQAQDDVEIHEVVPLTIGATGLLFKVTVRRKGDAGKVRIKTVPSENFRIDPQHRSLSLDECRFCEHLEDMSLSDIRELLDDPSLTAEELRAGGGTYSNTGSAEANARDRLNVTGTSIDKQDMGTVADVYIRADVDGDGVDELRHVIVVGGKIRLNEQVERMPFAAICPCIMPFNFYGLSIADLVMDVQRTKSKIIRAQLDSLYLSIAPRTAVMESMVNLNDLLVNRPGGVVRFKGPPRNLMEQMTIPFVGQQAFPMLEYQDSLKENRTGWTRYSQGLDAESLNKTATGVSIISSAAQKRMRLIARMFAETGMRDLFIGIIWLLSKHQTRQLHYRLRGKFAQTDPREWKTQFDVTVNVGVGNKDLQAAMQSLQMLGTFQGMLLTQLGKPHLVSDKNLYNTGMLLAEAAGYKQEGQFFTPAGPDNPPAPPPPNPDIEKQKMQIQADGQKSVEQQKHEGLMQQAKSQFTESLESMKGDQAMRLEQVKAQLALEQTKMELQAKIMLEREKMQIDLQKHAMDVAMQKQVLEEQQAFQKQEGDKQRSTDMMVEQKKADTDIQKAKMTRQVQLSRGKDGTLSGKISG